MLFCSTLSTSRIIPDSIKIIAWPGGRRDNQNGLILKELRTYSEHYYFMNCWVSQELLAKFAIVGIVYSLQGTTREREGGGGGGGGGGSHLKGVPFSGWRYVKR